MNIQRTVAPPEILRELELLEYNDYHFFRYTSIIVAILPVAFFSAVNLNSSMGAATTITLLLWECLLLLFSVLQYNARTNLNLLLTYRNIQFWIYRFITAVWVALFVWSVVIMLTK